MSDAIVSPAPPVASAAPAIPFKPAASAEAGGIGFPGAALACLLLLVAAIVALRRWGPRGARLGGSARAVEIVESHRLADRMRVSVVRWRGRELLVAHSEQVATVLATEAWPTGRDGAP